MNQPPKTPLPVAEHISIYFPNGVGIEVSSNTQPLSVVAGTAEYFLEKHLLGKKKEMANIIGVG